MTTAPKFFSMAAISQSNPNTPNLTAPQQQQDPNTPSYSDVSSPVSVAGTKKKRKRKYTYQCREISSFKVFNSFVTYDAEGKCHARDILSPACYAQWVASRRKMPKKPEEAFRRALTAHCRGVDGRRPFAPEVEEDLLKELRKKQQWRCFENLPNCGSIGVQGFPSLGYHERLNQQKQAQLNSVIHNRGVNPQVGRFGVGGLPQVSGLRAPIGQLGQVGELNGQNILLQGYSPALAWDYTRYGGGLYNMPVMGAAPHNQIGINPAEVNPAVLKQEGNRRASAVFTKNILGVDYSNQGVNTEGLEPFY